MEGLGMGNEAIISELKYFGDLIKRFIQRVREIWSQMKSVAGKSVEIIEALDNRKQQFKQWKRVSRVATPKHQVMNRKPLMITARTTC
jgi:hypothetical protein